MKNNKTILKTISYRVMGSLITFITSMILGVPFEWASIIGISELFIKPLLYYTHEIMWSKYYIEKNKLEVVESDHKLDKINTDGESIIKRLSYISERK
jgi:uncharacterized membrane protein